MANKIASFANIVWWRRRCIFSSVGYVTNATDFWVASGAVESSVAGPLSVIGLPTGVKFYVTCALRSSVTDVSLTWLENVTNATLLNPPVLNVTTVLMDSLTVSVMTNMTGSMAVKCVLFSGISPMDTVDFWSNFPAATITTSGATNIVFSNISSNYNYTVMCAQYPSEQTFVASSAIVMVNATTLPKCSDIVNPCPKSLCINPLDSSAYQCAPYFDGGVALGSVSDTCRGAGGTSDSLTVTKTSGNETVSFCMNAGTRFSWTEITQIARFFYGMVNSPTRFQCTNPSFSSVVNNSFRVSCQTAQGMGANLRLLVALTFGNVAGVEALSYPPPKIFSSTLRLPDAYNTSGAASVVAPTSDPTVVAFAVLNVELQPELQVFYGDSDIQSCVLDPRTNSSFIFCRTDAATEFISGFTFSVNANGQVPPLPFLSTRCHPMHTRICIL